MRGNSFSDVVNTAFGAWMPMPFSSIHCAKTWSADGYPRTNFGLNELTVWAWVWRASSLMSNDERFLTFRNVSSKRAATRDFFPTSSDAPASIIVRSPNWYPAYPHPRYV